MVLFRKSFILFILTFLPFFVNASNFFETTKQNFFNNELRILDIIAKKKDKKTLSQKEINYFIQEYTSGNIPDYQAAALLMAIYINGMSDEETAFLTDAMTRSGNIMNFKDFSKPIIDKHSTGGVGDKTSLIIGPICSALGINIPMISGRGLGHAGGTLDKLESIPDLLVDQDTDNYKRLLKEIGLCIIGQTKDIAPADKKIYSLRDASGSIESIPLIASSIMSKKLAEGLDALVMDVKTGKGAFIKDLEDSYKLAEIMRNIGRQLGKKVITIISDMDQPLGMYVGHSLEVIESVQILKGICLPGQKDLRDLSFTLAAHMLIAAKIAKDEKDAREKILSTIQDGSAFQKFKDMIKAQNGNPNAIEDFSLLPHSNYKFYLKATKSGFINTLDAMNIAKACSILGGGRTTMDSKIDLSVGCIIYKKIGDYVEIGDDLLEIHYNSEEKFNVAVSFFESAYIIDKIKMPKPILIKKILI